MTKIHPFSSVASLALLGVIAPANASQELAQKNNCLACPSVATKVVGPAYQDVAKKYKGQKDADTTLVDHIKKGGSGRWGLISMPAQTVSDADAKTLAKWILGLAK